MNNKNTENLNKIDSEITESISVLSNAEQKKIYYVIIHNEDGTNEKLYSFNPFEIEFSKAKIKNYFKPSIKEDTVLGQKIVIEYFNREFIKDVKEFVWINNKAIIYEEDLSLNEYDWIRLNEKDAIEKLQVIKNNFLMNQCDLLSSRINLLESQIEEKDNEINALKATNDELYEIIHDFKRKYENKKTSRNINF